ncbi:MAG TPA: DNA topoisomerase VI subunit B [Fibrobacteria bacterium]|nr:DNA topoisomerase VI subunit B [Fibrobacteria bacterium]
MAGNAPDAQSMAKKQQEISVADFFAKNRHMLGFDNARKALLTAVKEAVDNSLDACEEARILPRIRVEIRKIEATEDHYVLSVRDNGPGIMKAQIPRVFGKLLYGSKFHRLRMSRGQQGIGISAAGMYGQITTAKPVQITSRPHKSKPAHYYELRMDLKRNEPEILVDKEVEWGEAGTGTMVDITMKATFFRGRQSVDEYLEQTAIANPHAEFSFLAPDGTERTFPRAATELPPEPVEIQPHPHGIELGIFTRLLHDSPHRSMGVFLTSSFSRVTSQAAGQVCRAAGIPLSAVPGDVHHAEAEKLFHALQKADLPPPRTDCLAPIGVEHILKGMHKELGAEFYAATTRKPAIYRGNPFQIEVGLAWGGKLESDSIARVIRFANRVPLQYQLSACASTKSVMDVAWKSYGLQQSKGSLPVGPLVIMVHMASVWVPFTNQAKEAIADYDEIRKEFKLALQEAGRKVGIYLKKKQAAANQAKRRNIFNAYIEEVVKAYQSITKEDGDDLRQALLDTARKKTELAEKLEAMKHKDAPEELEGTLVIGEDGQPLVPGSAVVSEKDLAQDDSEPGIPASEQVASLKDGDDETDLESLLPAKSAPEHGAAKVKPPRAEAHGHAAPTTLSLFGDDDA